MSNKIENYIEINKKSGMAAFILGLLLGPIGLFYVNWVAALVLLLVAVAGAATIVIPFAAWILSAIMAPFLADSHNSKLRAQAELFHGGRD